MTTSRRFSRWMGPLRPAPSLRDRPNGVALLGLLAFLAVSAAVTQPLVALGVIGVLAVLVLVGWMRPDPVDQLFASRPGHQGICTFVRHPDVRDADPWVLRAVFEALEELLAVSDQTCAVLPTDSLEVDLRVTEDLTWELQHIAARARRIPPDTRDPCWAEVQTVGDLVNVLDSVRQLGFMRAVILILAVSAAVSARPVGAQVALSSADSLSVLLQTLDAAASDTVYRSTPMFTEDRVLWWATEGDLLPSGQILDQLRQSYPNLRVADDLRDVYLCDDGGLPRYPLDPCRVKDGGVILRFGRIATPPDEFDVSVSFSYANSRGISGWRSGFMRVEGGLKLSHFRQIWIS